MTLFQQQMDCCLNRIEADLASRMDRLPKGLQAQVVEAMKYSLLGGGKRIRALLVLEFCRICGGDPEQALPFAAAIEMVHAYSLIHDDLPCMDDDDLRRGKPSCHIAFGEAIALLAGDALLTLAFETAADADLAPRQTLRAVRELSHAAGTAGMIGGQVLDIENLADDLDTLQTMCAMKTGALIRVAARLGCIAAGAGEEQIRLADRYGQKMGLAFQITDDILDITGDAAVLGKPVGSDAGNQKTTFTTLLPLETADALAQELLEESLAAVEEMTGSGEFIVQLTHMLATRRR